MSTTSVTIGGREYTVGPFTGRKATRALRLLKEISRAAPDLINERAQFRRRYAEQNVVELDRVQALADFGPDHLAHLTEQDWTAAGNKLRIARAPSTEEEILAVFPTALERAEDLVAQLLALVTYSNEDIARYAKEGCLNDHHDGTPGKLTERASELLDAGMVEELATLAVVAGEVIDTQFKAVTEQLGDRVGKALRVFGLTRPASTTPTPTSEMQPTTPPSSGASDEPTSASASTPSTSPTEPSLISTT